MPPSWTQDRVLSLAPDAASASSGQGLASPRKWTSLGRSDRAIWGLCQGSGKEPYQARVELGEPAFKCSCPSRKFPCKHGLGLLLIFAKEEKAFKEGAEPAWVTDWLSSRAERAEKKAQKAAEPQVPVDAEAAARRAAKREERVRDGLSECRVWIEDLVRRGLAAAQSEPSAFWERAAARMVDAQAPGLARLLRLLPLAMGSGEAWPQRTLGAIARIHLLLRAAEKLDSLPPDLAADVRTLVGWNTPKEEVLSKPGVPDRWVVAGQVTEEEERLRVRRSWLLGRTTGRRALILDFAAGAQPMDASIIAGSEFDGELVFYPSNLPLRALVKSRGDAAPAGPVSIDTGAGAALDSYAQALARNPWLERWAIALARATPAISSGRCLILDPESRALPVRPGFTHAWKLMAISGGRPVTLVGEWDGEFLTPLAAWAEASAFDDLAPRFAA